ncbi:MAG: L,D-transpeptidase family protein [Minwuia sp.]|nr:L,D-transpeptidase family protein [Minwuia sp.]
MALLHVFGDGFARLGRSTYDCALGSSGIVADKREGDGGTPVGTFAIRRLMYRHDRIGRPRTALPAQPILRTHGWCDDPGSPGYNRQIRLPSTFGHEELWRADGLYDLVLVIGHNDRPVVAGGGSAVFVHVARPDMAPTEGCVAFAFDALMEIITRLRPGDTVRIEKHAT